MSWENIYGWSGDIPEFYAFALARFNRAISSPTRPFTVAEIGSAWGRSAACLATLAIEANTPVTIYAVDAWQEHMGGEQEAAREFYEWAVRQGSPKLAFEAALEKFVPSAKPFIFPVQGQSPDVADEFPDETLDLVFIDADHNYGPVVRDIVAWTPKVRPGGLLAGHDFSEENFPGVVRAVNEAFPGQFKTQGVCWWVER